MEEEEEEEGFQEEEESRGSLRYVLTRVVRRGEVMEMVTRENSENTSGVC